jgi:D-glycero-D-manno-heptose 1,7-bisphosphate phosphatase
MKAVFFDRDGTLIVDKNYLFKPEDVEYFQDTFDALKIIQRLGYECFIVTNQSGVGRGIFSIDCVYSVHELMQKDMKKHGLKPFRAIKICPQHPDDSPSFRKPSPEMIFELKSEYPQLQLDQSFMIGDKIIDAQCGENAGCTGVMLDTIFTTKYPTYKNLTEFAQYLLSLKI